MIPYNTQQSAGRALKRMLANGPLTAVPKRPDDQRLLVALAAGQFEPPTTYREAEVNERLKEWLQTFCDPDGIDHVTLRRLLVDSRLLTRTPSGSTYRVNRERLDEVQAVAQVEPAQVLVAIRGGREARKRRHEP